MLPMRTEPTTVVVVVMVDKIFDYANNLTAWNSQDHTSSRFENLSHKPLIS